MFDARLFLGFSVDANLKKQLDGANHNILKYFINDTGEYLCLTSSHEEDFIGKILGDEVNLKDLELIEANINSIITKILPEHNSQNYPMRIVPVLGEK